MRTRVKVVWGRGKPYVRRRECCERDARAIGHARLCFVFNESDHRRNALAVHSRTLGERWGIGEDIQRSETPYCLFASAVRGAHAHPPPCGILGQMGTRLGRQMNKWKARSRCTALPCAPHEYLRGVSVSASGIPLTYISLSRLGC